MAKTPTSKRASELTVEQLEAAAEKAAKTFGHRPNVTGVDYGFRYKDGKRLPLMGVRIHVKEKIPLAALEAAEVLPQEIDGVPVDVIQAVYRPHGAAVAAEPEATSRKTRNDPIQPGISVSHTAVTSGTLGSVVYDSTTGRQGILSNWHVFAGSGSARPGDAIVQPGTKWGGRSPQDRIAKLERFILDAHGDAALALLNNSRGVASQQMETGALISEARKVSVGEIVEKSGATTAVTRGLVEGIGQYTLDYSVGTRTIQGFKVVAEKEGNPDGLEISSGGDSGSLWYSTADSRGVGLHFAGETDPNPSEEHALACHLPAVLEQLSVSLVPVGPVPPALADEGYAPLSDIMPQTSAEQDRLIIETVARLARILELICLRKP